MKTTFNFRRVLRDSVRLYFAPLTGAYKGVRDEVARNDQDSKNRNRQDRARESSNHA